MRMLDHDLAWGQARCAQSRGFGRPKRTRPSTQYAVNDLASPGHWNRLAPSGIPKNTADLDGRLWS